MGELTEQSRNKMHVLEDDVRSLGNEIAGDTEALSATKLHFAKAQMKLIAKKLHFAKAQMKLAYRCYAKDEQSVLNKLEEIKKDTLTGLIRELKDMLSLNSCTLSDNDYLEIVLGGTNEEFLPRLELKLVTL